MEAIYTSFKLISLWLYFVMPTIRLGTWFQLFGLIKELASFNPFKPRTIFDILEANMIINLLVGY